MSSWILFPVFLPAIAGIYLLLSSFREHLVESRSVLDVHEMDNFKKGRHVHILTGIVLVISAAAALVAAWSGDHSVTLFYLMDEISVYFKIDAMSRLFVTFVSIVWVVVGFYAFVYMKHEGEEKRFFGFYLIVYGVLVALDFSGNLVTMYLFYELMTLTSVPLVLHNGSREAIMASLKYLFYSMCGAYLGLFGIFFLYQNCDSLTFTVGGTLNMALAQENTGILLIAVFAMLIGFGAKAGMLPLHAWLPAAHPVAPSPASAVLSGIIVKSGVLAVIRVVFYIVGPDFIRGTWVQTGWMILTLITVFMGSLLAFREPVLKKRLAYSTVSQVSYILFGLSVLSSTAMSGALMHTVFHAFIKSALFLTAGIFIFRCNKTRVEDLAGIGKKMPKTLWCYTFAALALIGIPPTSGFISKWYLAEGSLEANIGIFCYLGPIVLLVSALLTAGYLLPISLKGFLPGKDFQMSENAAEEKKVCEVSEPSCGMLVPLTVLTVLTLLLGLLPNPLTEYVSQLASTLL